MILSITQAGKKIRLGRIINQKTGRAVIAAMDHGLVLGPVKGIERIENTLKKVLPGKPDAVMMNLGSVKRCLNGFLGREAPGLILRLDDPICARPIIPFEETDQTVSLYSAEDAIKIGASAVITTLFIGLAPEENERYNIEYVTKHIQECEKWDCP